VEFLEFHDAWFLNHLNHVPKYQKQDIYIPLLKILWRKNKGRSA